MGLHTVAFLLNDFASSIELAPKTTAYLLFRGNDYTLMNGDISYSYPELAKYYNEPEIHSQALKVFLSTHISHTQYFRAGQGCCDELECVGVSVVDGQHCVILKLPEYLQK